MLIFMHFGDFAWFRIPSSGFTKLTNPESYNTQGAMLQIYF